jgi:hypothetical protein
VSQIGEEALFLRNKMQKEGARILGIDTAAFKIAGRKLKGKNIKEA